MGIARWIKWWFRTTGWMFSFTTATIVYLCLVLICIGVAGVLFRVLAMIFGVER